MHPRLLMRGAWLLSVDEVAIIRRVGEVVWSVASTSALLIHFAPTRPVCDRASLSQITAWAFLVLMVPLVNHHLYLVMMCQAACPHVAWFMNLQL